MSDTPSDAAPTEDADATPAAPVNEHRRALGAIAATLLIIAAIAWVIGTVASGTADSYSYNDDLAAGIFWWSVANGTGSGGFLALLAWLVVAGIGYYLQPREPADAPTDQKS